MITSRLVKVGLSAALAMAWLSPATAQSNYPTKPIRVIVPFGPGGVADVTARLVAQGLNEKLGQSIIVENMPSAGGISAAQNFLRAPADGYTLFIVNNQNAVSPSLFKNLPYDPVKQFSMISMVGEFDLVVAVDKASPHKNLQDMLKAAHANPDRFNIATIAVGSTQHLSSEMFRAAAKVESPTIPFKSSGEVITAVRGGNADVLFETLPAVIGNLKSGDLRALAFTSAKRNPQFTDVPTVDESGVKGYAASSWNGFAAPAGTPKEIITKLNTVIREVVADPSYNKRLVDIGMQPRTNTPEEFHAFLQEEIKKWNKVIVDAKIPQQ